MDLFFGVQFTNKYPNIQISRTEITEPPVCELLLNLHCRFKNISASHFDFSNLLITFAVTLQINTNSYRLNKYGKVNYQCDSLYDGYCKRLC